MASYEILGDKKDLGKSPVSSPSSNPKGGKYQTVGDNVPLGRNAISSPSSNPKGGAVQQVGTDVSLNRTPVKGWGSADNLPMSDRAIAQSKNAAGGSKKGRRR